MALKLLLLAAAAVAVFVLTRPRGRIGRGARREETAMAKCDKCGVYRAAGESCDCE